MRKTDIRAELAEAFFERGSQDRPIHGSRCKRIPASRVVAFEDVEDLLALLTFNAWCC